MEKVGVYNTSEVRIEKLADFLKQCFGCRIVHGLEECEKTL